MANPDDAQPPKNKGGRPLGAVSKLAKDAREKAQATGQLPHEILLDMARGVPQPVYRYDQEKQALVIVGHEVGDLDQRRDAAKAAAPYFAPKITAVEVVGNMRDDELDRFIASLAAEAGIAFGAGGESEEGEEEEGAASPAPRRRAVLKR